MAHKPNSRPVQVRITHHARRDLAAIYGRRLAQRGAGGSDGADALLDELAAAALSLAEFSLRGPVPPELEALGINDYRQLSVPPYRIIYLPEEHGEARFVTIMIIADSRRDFRTLLEERLLRSER
jgi:toxin ParE1/3/4